jgi:hypothetical protein
MLKRIITAERESEGGQSLAIFALSLMVLLGAVAMSVDVGRYVWARTQMQAAVDASALAAAQSMPNQTDAELKAGEYWLDNSSFIQGQGTNIAFGVTYPPGNKAISVQASADIPTYFAKFFGVDHWEVSAEGDAEAQVLDISVVLDISGSMCWDIYPDIESGTAWLGPGNPTITLTQPIAASTSSRIWIYVDNADIFEITSSSQNMDIFGYSATTTYWQRNIGGRNGIIRIDNEIFDIESTSSVPDPVDSNNDRLYVQRAQPNNHTGTGTSQSAHAVGAEIWANRTSEGCEWAAPSLAGPYGAYDSMVSAANYFTTLFNSSYDKIGVAQYSYESDLVESLNSNFVSVRSAISSMNPPGGSTNIAHGIAVGRQILDGPGKRANAVRVLVVLTDGVANRYCGSSSYNSASYDSTSCSDNSSTTYGVSHALAEAQRAADGDIIIFTIGLGYDLDQAFLEEIADIGGGSFYLSPTPAELDDAFQAIAEQTHIALVR